MKKKIINFGEMMENKLKDVLGLTLAFWLLLWQNSLGSSGKKNFTKHKRG